MKVSLTQWLDCDTKLRRLYCVGSDRKYFGAKQVERGDLLRSGLVPPRSEETDHSGVSERVQPSRQSYAESVGKTTKVKPQRAAQQPHDVRSCPFSVVTFVRVGVTARYSLESVGRVSLRPPPVHHICAGGKARKKCSRLLRVARAQQHRPASSLSSYLRPFVFLRREARESAVLPVMYDNRFGCTSCYTAYLLWQRSKMETRPRNASRGTSHWHPTVRLLVSSPIFIFVALNPLLQHLGGTFFFFQGFFATFRPATFSRRTAAYLASFS